MNDSVPTMFYEWFTPDNIFWNHIMRKDYKILVHFVSSGGSLEPPHNTVEPPLCACLCVKVDIHNRKVKDVCTLIYLFFVRVFWLVLIVIRGFLYGLQSSGKSSVLEGIVGRDFLPRGSGKLFLEPTFRYFFFWFWCILIYRVWCLGEVGKNDLKPGLMLSRWLCFPGNAGLVVFFILFLFHQLRLFLHSSGLSS